MGSQQTSWLARSGGGSLVLHRLPAVESLVEKKKKLIKKKLKKKKMMMMMLMI